MNILSLTEAFYDAAWDLAERITLLPQEINLGSSELITTPEILLRLFKKSALPFLDLEGKNIPQKAHVHFDQIDTTVRENIFPAMETLQEEWDSYRSKKVKGHDDLLGFSSMCTQVTRSLELEVIAITSAMKEELKQMALAA